jgi:hypothetical protein
MVASGVESAAGADLRRALRDQGLLRLDLREGIGLELGTAKEAGFSCPAIVEGDERVPGELAAEVERVRAKGEGA